MHYTVSTEKIPQGQRFWDHLKVEIFDSSKNKIGEYTRNYPTLFRTFCPFRQDGREYALYSPRYVFTRVMTLPECKDIGGEEYAPGAFCPTDYYVPDELDGRFGFIAGCLWGDDSSWKIQFLDLRDPANPIRLERFGYIALPNSHKKLSDIVQIEKYDGGVEIRIQSELLVAIEDEEFAQGIRDDNQFYGLASSEDRELRELRAENENLKKRLTELSNGSAI